MWITLTSADFNSRLAASEITVVASANAQGDNRAAILAEVTGEVRGYVARRNALGPEGTIPDELKNAAMSVATERFIGQVPDAGLLTESRQEAAKSGVRLFRDVASGNFAIVPPETESTPQPATPLPSIGARREHFSHRDERGI